MRLLPRGPTTCIILSLSLGSANFCKDDCFTCFLEPLMVPQPRSSLWRCCTHLHISNSHMRIWNVARELMQIWGVQKPQIVQQSNWSPRYSVCGRVRQGMQWRCPVASGCSFLFTYDLRRNHLRRWNRFNPRLDPAQLPRIFTWDPDPDSATGQIIGDLHRPLKKCSGNRVGMEIRSEKCIYWMRLGRLWGVGMSICGL